MEGSFWWKSHLKLLDRFKGICRCNIGDKKTALFWTDLWEENYLSHKYPHLVTFAKATDMPVQIS
jgi:hypothetical protein